MGRLIDADEFTERVKKAREHEIYLRSWTADMVLDRLNSWYAPTVKAVSISVLEQIKAEVLDYVEDLDIANEICEVFDKHIKERE